MTSGEGAEPERRHPRHDLLSGPVARTLWIFALPTLAANMLQSLNGAVNAIWVGQLLGEKAVAATTNANLVMFMLFALSFGFSMAITVLIGQCMGRRDTDGMRRFVGAGVALFSITGIVSAIAGWIGIPAILGVLRTPPEIWPLAITYARVSFLSLPAGLMIAFLQSAMRGTGDSMTPLWFVLGATLIDVALNPLFILGAGPLPPLGIAGSALSTVVANMVVLLAMVAWIYRRDLPIRLRHAEWRYVLPARSTVGVIVHRGVPMGLQMILVTFATLTMAGLINVHGTTTVAAYGAASQLWTYVQMPGFAIAAAVSMMAAQSIGADRWDRIPSILGNGIWLNMLLTGGLVLLFELFDRQLLGWFLGSATDAIEVARHINRIAAWGLVFQGMAMVIGAIPRANGATMVPLINAFIALVPGRVGVAMLLEPRMGVDGLWWSFPSAYILSLLLTAAYYRWGKWREIRLLR